MAYKFQLGDARMSGSLTQEEGVTVDSGGLTVTAGGLTVSAGTSTLQAADVQSLALNSGGITAAGAIAGATTVSGSGAGSFGSMTLDGALALQSAGITAAGAVAGVSTLDASGLASLDGGIDVNGNMTVSTAGAIAGATSIDASGDLTVGSITNANFTVSSAGAVVASSTVSGAAGSFDALDGTSLALQSGGITAAGAIAGVSSLSATANLDIGAYDLRAQTLTADSLTSGRVLFAGTNGVLSDDSDMSFSVDTLTVTKLGAFEAAGAINFANQDMTNVDIDSGAMDGVIIGAASQAAAEFTTMSGSGVLQVGGASTFAGALSPLQDDAYDLGSAGKEWQDLYLDGVAYIDDLRADALGAALDCASQAMTNINVDSGNIDGTIIGAASQAAAEFTTMSGSGVLHAVGAATFGASVAATGSITAGSSFIIGSADLNEVDMEKLDGITDGTGAANKALVLDGSSNISAGLAGLTGSAGIRGGSLHSDGALYASGDLTVDTNASLNGNVGLGNATGDTLNFNGRAGTSLVPSADSSYDLGSDALRWSTIYADSFVGDITFDVESVAAGGTITSTTDFALITSGDGGTVTMPTAVAGKVVRVKLSSSVGDAIIAAASGDVIEDAANVRLESTGSAVILVAYDTQSWFIL